LGAVRPHDAQERLRLTVQARARRGSGRAEIAAEQGLNVLGSKENARWNGTRNDAKKTVRLLLIAAEGLEDRSQFWRRRLQTSKIAREVVDTVRLAITFLLVCRECRLQLRPAVETIVERSSKVLAGNVGIYAFISTISVYRNYGAPGIDEDSPVARLDDDELIARRDTGAYGPRKARCEEIVTEAFPEQTLTVRCGLIGGPHDNVGRLTYWPRRVAMGGEVLAPGAPGRMFQVIDARDLSEWVVRMVEQGRAGTFNAVGAATAFGTLLDVSKDRTGSDATFVWCTDQFLVEQGVAPQTELPLWSPVRPGSDGHYGISNERARATGLALRPCRDTIRAILDWAGDAPARAVGAGGAVGLSPDRERELLRAWRRS